MDRDPDVSFFEDVHLAHGHVAHTDCLPPGPKLGPV